MNKFRVIPSIEQLRQRDAVQQLEERYGHEAVVAVLREETSRVRMRLGAAHDADNTDTSEGVAREIEEGAAGTLRDQLAPSLQPVINATGVIVHTNLGRAPLPRAAIERITAVSAYSNLEFDLATGTRGSRSVHAAALLQRLTGAEDATVVNNNAAGVLLTLTALASGRDVIISRGEMVEIGGGFRIPDVMRQSGARLREVGTTNRTRAADYAAAITDDTGLVLRVHPSNFRIQGFSERPPLSAVVDVAQRFGVPVVEDLGSGNLLTAGQKPAAARPGWDEPTVSASISAGVDVCCFSGDKLLGGPQAGLIVGRRACLEPIRRHPLMRALRADKLVYAALEATLVEHAAGRAAATVPVASMIQAPVASLEQRAASIIEAVSDVPGLTCVVGSGRSAIGGGTTPGLTLPSCVLVVHLEGATPDDLEAQLRGGSPHVIGRIERDEVRLDLRTVLPTEDGALVAALRTLADRR